MDNGCADVQCSWLFAQVLCRLVDPSTSSTRAAHGNPADLQRHLAICQLSRTITLPVAHLQLRTAHGLLFVQSPVSLHFYMPIAFKEWAVTVRALAEGEQLLTLRKGGIREPDKHFKLDYDRFFLYPTFDHQCSDLVRESHQPELTRALEEGVWSDGEPSPHSLRRNREIPQPDRVRIRAWAEVAAHYTVTDRRTVDALSPFYVWTSDYAEKRLAWKRRHPLHVILLRTYRIPRPVTVKVRDEYGGCRSWLELTRDLPFEGTPVLSDDEFERASEEIASIASDREPVLV